MARGCLGCVAPDYAGLGHDAAQYVIRVLRGELPANLPVVDFDEYVTYINADTAKTLGLEIPEDIAEKSRIMKNEGAKKD